MNRTATTLIALVAMTGLATGDSKRLLVLQSEGRADLKIRTTVDAAIVKLAAKGGDQASAGEINYTDAAALVGCKPDEASCRAEVIASLAVDEIIITAVNPKPGGFEVFVRRAGKGGVAKDATVTITADKADKLDGLNPLFNIKPVGPTTPPVTDPPVIGPTTPPTTPVTPPVGPTPPVTDPPVVGPTTPPITEPAKTGPASTTKQQADLFATAVAAREKRNHRLQIAGMAGGGGLVLLSFVLWGVASSKQGDINDFQVRNGGDFQRLQDLEKQGAAAAAWGNLFFVGGLALAGVSTYYYVKARKKKTIPKTAIAPALFDRGAGVVLTIGGGL